MQFEVVIHLCLSYTIHYFSLRLSWLVDNTSFSRLRTCFDLCDLLTFLQVLPRAHHPVLLPFRRRASSILKSFLLSLIVVKHFHYVYKVVRRPCCAAATSLEAWVESSHIGAMLSLLLWILILRSPSMYVGGIFVHTQLNSLRIAPTGDLISPIL